VLERAREVDLPPIPTERMLSTAMTNLLALSTRMMKRLGLTKVIVGVRMMKTSS